MATAVYSETGAVPIDDVYKFLKTGGSVFDCKVHLLVLFTDMAEFGYVREASISEIAAPGLQKANFRYLVNLLSMAVVWLVLLGLRKCSRGLCADSCRSLIRTKLNDPSLRLFHLAISTDKNITSLVIYPEYHRCFAHWCDLVAREG